MIYRTHNDYINDILLKYDYIDKLPLELLKSELG